MSIQKKSLVGSRPAEKKVSVQSAKQTDAIGEPKGLTANALTSARFKSSAKTRRYALRYLKGKN